MALEKILSREDGKALPWSKSHSRPARRSSGASLRGVWFEACSYPPRVRIAFYQRGVRGVGVDVVREGEGLDALSARLGVPGCMLLRANRLFSPAWLLPGREIEVPDGDFCRYDDYPCPVGALYRPVREEQEE